MRRFYFDLLNAMDTDDMEGLCFDGLEAATAHAVAEAREMVATSAHEGAIDLSHSIVIRDDEHGVVGKVRFEDAVRFVRSGIAL